MLSPLALPRLPNDEVVFTINFVIGFCWQSSQFTF